MDDSFAAAVAGPRLTIGITGDRDSPNAREVNWNVKPLCTSCSDSARANRAHDHLQAFSLLSW